MPWSTIIFLLGKNQEGGKRAIFLYISLKILSDYAQVKSFIYLLKSFFDVLSKLNIDVF